MKYFLQTTLSIFLFLVFFCLGFLFGVEYEKFTSPKKEPINLHLHYSSAKKSQNRYIKSSYTNVEFSCLARTIYFEAGNQSYGGKLAVGNVVMNRVESEKYPNTICGVVHQYKQFSWYEKYKDIKPYEGKAWKDSIRAAKQVLETGPIIIAGDIHHYHADYVSPSWAKQMERVAKIDDHIFYR
tara:strand:- start:1422 stop:1970 length:549 start_codon:yes stop_codon:yes gene_type:complete